MGVGKCGLCGRSPAAGFASVNGVWYCHGDDDPEPTCYMRAQVPEGLNKILLDPVGLTEKEGFEPSYSASVEDSGLEPNIGGRSLPDEPCTPDCRDCVKAGRCLLDAA